MKTNSSDPGSIAPGRTAGDGAESAFAQAPTCNQVLTQDCLYFPSTRYAFTELERLATYKDAAGALRTVKVLLRIPTAAPLPMPVVIWSHGGADGKDNPPQEHGRMEHCHCRGRILDRQRRAHAARH